MIELKPIDGTVLTYLAEFRVHNPKAGRNDSGLPKLDLTPAAEKVAKLLFDLKVPEITKASSNEESGQIQKAVGRLLAEAFQLADASPAPKNGKTLKATSK